MRELQPAAADARDAARCLTACYVSNHGPETALAKPFISDSELCCVAGGGIVIARCSVQCAACRPCQDWPAGRATPQLLNLYSLQVRKTRPGVVQEPYLLWGHQLAPSKDTSKQRTRRSLRFERRIDRLELRKRFGSNPATMHCATPLGRCCGDGAPRRRHSLPHMLHTQQNICAGGGGAAHR